MPQIGPLEILVVAAVALIVFGPQRLPEITRSIGKTLGELRRVAGEVKAEFESGLDVDEDEDQPEPVRPDQPGRKDPDELER